MFVELDKMCIIDGWEVTAVPTTGDVKLQLLLMVSDSKGLLNFLRQKETDASQSPVVSKLFFTCKFLLS